MSGPKDDTAARQEIEQLAAQAQEAELREIAATLDMLVRVVAQGFLAVCEKLGVSQGNPPPGAEEEHLKSLVDGWDAAEEDGEGDDDAIDYRIGVLVDPEAEPDA